VASRTPGYASFAVSIGAQPGDRQVKVPPAQTKPKTGGTTITTAAAHTA
jgi:hypothetical protein